MTTNQNQSIWPLQKPQQLVYVELGQDNGGMMLGVCEQGISYRLVSPLRADGPVNFTISLDGKTLLEGTGEIVWSEDGGKTGGLQFTVVSPEFRESLRSWLASESTPKNVGREVTPAVALPLEPISKLKSNLRMANVEDAERAAPPRHPEAKPDAFESPEPVVGKPFNEPAVEPKHTEDEAAEQHQPEEPIGEREAHALAPSLPPGIEAKPLERDLREEKSASAEKPEGITGETELRTVAPIAAAEPQFEAGFSLPNFRLHSAPVPHLPMEEIVPPAARTLPLEEPEIPLPVPPSGLPDLALLGTETPVPSGRPSSQEFFPEGIVSETPRLNRAAAAVIISVTLAVILAALVFSFRRDVGEAFIRFGEMLAGPERAPVATQQPVNSAAARDSSPSSAAPSENTAGPSSVPSQDEPLASRPEPSTSAPSVPAAGSAIENGSSPDPASANPVKRMQDLPSPPEGGSGQKEFEQARKLLKGNHRQQDLPRAVNLLWTAVQKGYVRAEVTLADLYLRGDGVARSCAQARVLLEAAVQKGSPEAHRRLNMLKEQGCS